MMKVNYQLEMEKLLREAEQADRRQRLLIHACCAPCSSAVLERLTAVFDITVFFYNPNIAPEEEFRLRASEQRRLIDEMPKRGTIDLILGSYDNDVFELLARGLEHAPEGGERCTRCYRLRLNETAKAARDGGYDYFTTTLSISPLKDAARLNAIGAEFAERYGVKYLYSDFKKKNGYKRSCELSKEYGLYRQDYCGCVYSKKERENQTIVTRTHERS